MAEFIEIMKQRERMCEIFIEHCSKCPIGAGNNGIHCACNVFLGEHPQEAEEIIMQWAKENPVKTNADVFREVFGLDIAKNHHSCLGIKCPDEQITCYGCAYDEFWDKEYKEPKGDK